MADRKDSFGNTLLKGESQRKNNTYSYRWRDTRGVNKSVYAKTLKELREKEELVQHEQIHKVDRNTNTVEQQIEEYLQLKTDLKISTRNNYEYYFNKKIKGSKFGKKKIINLKKSDVLSFYKELSDEGLSNGTIRIVNKLVHPALELAYEDSTIMRNPSNGCTKGYGTKKEIKYALTIEEEKEFMERVLLNFNTAKLYPLFGILLYSGMRISECLGLTWNDINMDSREIDINHQVLMRYINGKYTIYADSKMKTDAAIRTIPMNKMLYKMVLKQKNMWYETSMKSKYSMGKYEHFVFINDKTDKIWNANYIRTTINKIVKMNSIRDIQLPKISPHIFRHTACTRLAEAGVDIKVIQVYLGHNDPRTTLEVYNHVNKKRLTDELDKVAEVYYNFS